ncbi:MAG: hypothetical protein ACLUKN_07125 [Bacilli bacterium]
MMSHMRKSTIGNFRETIALLNGNRDKNAFKNHSTLPIYKKSVMKEASELGYNVDEFWLLDPNLNCKKLSAILRARGIRGGIIMGHTEGLRIQVLCENMERFQNSVRWHKACTIRRTNWFVQINLKCRARLLKGSWARIQKASSSGQRNRLSLMTAGSTGIFQRPVRRKYKERIDPFGRA